jgi:hydroxyacylglutathione hydrolase
VNWMSNFISHEEEFIILTEEGKELDIINRFFRIGYFNIRGYNKFNVDDLDADFVKPSVLKAEDLANVEDRAHLDVRNKPELASTGIIEGALHIPLADLEPKVHELKGKRPILVNCLSGMRSKIAFSVLTKHGVESHVLGEDFKELKDKGVSVVEYKE